MERNRRMESLIARRRAKKLFKGQIEKGQIDKKSMAPVLTKRRNHLDSSKDFDDGLDMPGSAPSFMPRSPYDIPYDPSEEKPNLTGDSFPKEFSSQKDMPFSRHGSFSSTHLFPSETKHDHGAREHYYFNKGSKYSDRLAYSRFRRHHTGDIHFFSSSFFFLLKLFIALKIRGHLEKLKWTYEKWFDISISPF